MLTLVLPSTVEEINLLQNSTGFSSPLFPTALNKGFENIPTEKRFKREVSLPNGVENWNLQNLESYLNILGDNPVLGFKADDSADGCQLVPEEGDERPRCDSFSSVASSMDERRVLFHNFGVKSFSTVCVDSGSTCISSDHSYLSPDSSVFKTLDAEETYQDLDMFIQEGSEVLNDSVPSPLSSTDSCFELPSLQTNFTLPVSDSRDAFAEKPLPAKRPAEMVHEDFYSAKSARLSDPPASSSRYPETRKKCNTSTKNCRKTRKEKQKEMDVRQAELESERERLHVQIEVLEELIKVHKTQLYAIMQRR